VATRSRPMSDSSLLRTNDKSCDTVYGTDFRCAVTYVLNRLIVSTKFNEKALREKQTLHAGCSKEEPKIFTPP